MTGQMKTLTKFSAMLLGCLIFLSAEAGTVSAQKKCNNTGEVQKFTFQNATNKPVDIKSLDANCKEDQGRPLGAGEQAGGSSYTGVIFRVYDLATGKLISEITLEKSKTVYVIEAAKKQVSPENAISPTAGFLQATNEIRSKKNLSAMQLDDKLNNACQFFAELMAQADKGPAHTASEIGLADSYKDRNKSSQRLAYYGWDKKNTVHFEVTALDTVEDYNLVGKHFAELWAFSTTHYKPFLDKDSTKYNRVGFGVAKAKSGTIRYYACAIFGKL